MSMQSDGSHPPSLPSASPSEDIVLVSQVVQGQEAAMARLFDLHSTYVYSFALSILKEKERAEDVLHAVFMQIWRTPVDFVRSGNPLCVDLTSLTRLHSINALQHRHVDLAIGNSSRYMHIERSETVNPITTHTEVKEVLAQLPKRTRAALELAFFGGCTIAEVAAVVGSSPEQIKTSIRAGLVAFRKRPQVQ